MIDFKSIVAVLNAFIIQITFEGYNSKVGAVDQLHACQLFNSVPIGGQLIILLAKVVSKVFSFITSINPLVNFFSFIKLLCFE
jgi:hypothetical protein